MYYSTLSYSPGPISGSTEYDTEAETEGGLRGHCGVMEDEVLLEKRGTGGRWVIGWGPHIGPSITTTKSRGGKGGRGVYLSESSFLPFPFETSYPYIECDHTVSKHCPKTPQTERSESV